MSISKFEIDFLKGQFFLSKSETPYYKNWNQLSIDSWLLETHPSLSVTKIYCNNTIVGVIVGYGLYDNNFLDNMEKIQIDECDIVSSFKTISQKIIGRFISLLITPLYQFLFPDAACTLSTLYDLENSMFGSSTLLFPNHLKHKDLTLERICVESSQIKGSVFPCGFTYFENIKVLKPNTYLDLKQLKVCNENSFILDKNHSFDLVCKNTFSLLNVFFQKIASKEKLEFFLTAGKDSRMLVACAGKLIKKIQFSTYYESNNIQSQLINCEVASNIAEKLELNYQSKDISIDLKKINNNNIAIIGFGGELSRGYLWKYKNFNNKITPDEVCSILGYSKHKLLLSEIESWLALNNNHSIENILDILYLDYYMGFLTSPTLYRYDCFSKYAIAPFCFSKIINLFLNLEIDTKNKDRFTRRFLDSHNSLLNSFPFF